MDTPHHVACGVDGARACSVAPVSKLALPSRLLNLAKLDLRILACYGFEIGAAERVVTLHETHKVDVTTKRFDDDG